MNSLVYLVLTSTKNRLLEIVRSPRKLAVYLLIIAGIVGFFLLAVLTHDPAEVNGSALDLIWLKGIFFALVAFFFLVSVSSGLKKGDAIFGMNDVNLLFVSPVNPRAILLYGVVRMMGIAFLMGFFILFQGNSLGTGFGVRFHDVVMLFLMFIFTVCIFQMVSLLIYSLTNGKPRGRMPVRLLTALLFAPMAGVGVQQLLTHGGDLQAAGMGLLGSPVAAWTPLLGWSAAAVYAFLNAEALTGLLFVGLMLAAAGALIAVIMAGNADYYEDVLVATESAFEKKRAAEEGGMSEEIAAVPGKIITAPMKGGGASALFYKHLRESFRGSRLGIWNVWSVLFVVVAVGVAVVIRLNDGGPGTLAILLQSIMWAQLFMVGMGRGISELSSHYVYMVPASAFSKLIWNNCEPALKVTAESVVMFTAAGVILQAPPLFIAATVLAYITFTLMLVSIYYLLLRFTGMMANQGVLILAYLTVAFVLLMPGLVPAVMVGTGGAAWSNAAGMGILAAWQLVVAVGCFWLSKGVLHKCDMPSAKLWR